MSTTTTSTHVGTVAEIYGAFGRGDVPFIMSCLADDVGVTGYQVSAGAVTLATTASTDEAARRRRCASSFEETGCGTTTVW